MVLWNFSRDLAVLEIPGSSQLCFLLSARVLVRHVMADTHATLHALPCIRMKSSSQLQSQNSTVGETGAGQN